MNILNYYDSTRRNCLRSWSRDLNDSNAVSELLSLSKQGPTSRRRR